MYHALQQVIDSRCRNINADRDIWTWKDEGKHGSTRDARVGQDCVIFDLDENFVSALLMEEAVGTSPVEDLIWKIQAPHSVWSMAPAGVVGQTLTK